MKWIPVVFIVLIISLSGCQAKGIGGEAIELNEKIMFIDSDSNHGRRGINGFNRDYWIYGELAPN